MASHRKTCNAFTAEEVAQICAFSDNNDSDDDSCHGGMDSGEESELDALLGEGIDSRTELSDNNIEHTENEIELGVEEVGLEDVDVDVDVERKDCEADGGQSSKSRQRGRRKDKGSSCATRRRAGRGRAVSTTTIREVCNQTTKSYEHPDTGNQIPPFLPLRPPGLVPNFHDVRGKFTRAIDFFELFFTKEIFNEICEHTNAYGWSKIPVKPYYGASDGSWKETNVDEMKKLIALILFCGVVNVSTFDRYWSTKTLYHGLWARRILSRDRFKALMAMLHIVDPSSEDQSDKLRKVRGLLEKISAKSKELYQPFQNLSVDERMVKSRHRSGMRQYIRNKPTKWGIKLWVLADSANGYTVDFDVYVGKNTQEQTIASGNGLGYDVVMKLVAPYTNQGYHLFFDNFYTSLQLVKDLFEKKTPACGTITENRKGFPQCMKDQKTWAKKKERGSMRWERDGCCLVQQWKDNKTVTMLTTIDQADKFVTVSRNSKIDNKWQKIEVKQPKCISTYNKYMNGVDRSDHLLSKYNTLRKCLRWWKVLFFHVIDISVVNSYLLFQLYRTEHKDIEALQRPSRYHLLEFREELVRQLAGFEEYGTPPVFQPPKPQPSQFETLHIIKFSQAKRQCKVCYDTTKQPLKVVTYCSAPQCNVFLHSTKDKNCFEVWHSRQYHKL